MKQSRVGLVVDFIPGDLGSFSGIAITFYPLPNNISILLCKHVTDRNIMQGVTLGLALSGLFFHQSDQKRVRLLLGASSF